MINIKIINYINDFYEFLLFEICRMFNIDYTSKTKNIISARINVAKYLSKNSDINIALIYIDMMDYYVYEFTYIEYEKAISRLGIIMKKYFKEKGKVYNIGRDKFLIIAKNKDTNLTYLSEKINGEFKNGNLVIPGNKWTSKSQPFLFVEPKNSKLSYVDEQPLGISFKVFSNKNIYDTYYLLNYFEEFNFNKNYYKNFTRLHNPSELYIDLLEYLKNLTDVNVLIIQIDRLISGRNRNEIFVKRKLHFSICNILLNYFDENIKIYLKNEIFYIIVINKILNIDKFYNEIEKLLIKAINDFENSREFLEITKESKGYSKININHKIFRGKNNLYAEYIFNYFEKYYYLEGNKNEKD